MAFDAFAAVVVVAGLVILAIRFTRGLGAVTNLSNDYPWGLWIGFDVLCGEALAAGGFTIAATVYLLGLERYRPLLRPAILTGLLGYAMAALSVLLDLGRPWRFPYPLVYSFGVSSILFLVTWLVLLYLTVQLIEFCPAVFEWLGWKAARRWAAKLTVVAVIVGMILATLHQSALGALYLLAPTKLHPLWYSPLLPVLFLVSGIVAGLSMVIFESWVAHRVFESHIDPRRAASLDELTLGLGKAASVGLLCYFVLKCIGVARGGHWDLLATPMGQWFLVELLGFVLLPCLLFAQGVRTGNATLVRLTGLVTVIGIVINRLNVSIIAFRPNAEQRYFPHWMEFVVTASIVVAGLLCFRWIVERMPVLREHPEYKGLD
jgi:Ni/Fe-hydrogenase subunit HybB-like protein